MKTHTPTSEILLRIEQIKKKAEARTENAAASIERPKAKVAQLPLWPLGVRSVPNFVLRSALFGAATKGTRAYLEQREIKAQKDITIIYTGMRLDQADLNVWMTVLHIMRLQALGSESRVTAYQFLKMLGKTDTGANRSILELRLKRLNATKLIVSTGLHCYEGALIDGVKRDEQTREYMLRLNPELNSLFVFDQFTQIDWNLRRALDGKPLAQWLHGYYSTHAKPYAICVAKLQAFSGSEGKLRRFQQTLENALRNVGIASAAHGLQFEYKILNGLVYIVKQGSASQRRHLAKKTNLLNRHP